MKLLTISNVNEIILLYPSSQFKDDEIKNALLADTKYAKRIWNWNTDVNHALRIVFVPSHNNSFTKYYPQLLMPKNEAIYYLPNDYTIASTSDLMMRSIQAGFELWKRNSKSVVVAATITTTKSHHPLISRWNSSTLEMEPTDKSHYLGNGIRSLLDSNTTTTDRNDENSTPPLLQLDAPFLRFLPICRDDATTTRNNDDDGYTSLLYLGSNNGMFIHQNYLCFLWHDLFQPLREYFVTTAQDEDIGDNVVILSFLISHLSGTVPRLFPSLVTKKADLQQHITVHDKTAKTRNSKKVKQDNELWQWSETEPPLTPREQMTKKDANDNIILTTRNKITNHDRFSRAEYKQTTTTTKQKRRNNEKMNTNTMEVWNVLTRYFGSVPLG